MPSYVYEYADTGETFTLQQRMSDDALTEHDGRECKRLICKPQVILRGDGWNGKMEGVDNFRKIYERNVEQAEPTRKLARDRGLDFTGDEGAIKPSDDDAPPDF